MIDLVLRTAKFFDAAFIKKNLVHTHKAIIIKFEFATLCKAVV